MTTSAPPPFTHPAQPLLPPHPRATTAMVLGIVGVAGTLCFLLPVVVSPLAWYFGAVAVRETEREPTRYRRTGEARTGMILGIVGTAILGVVLLLLVVVCALLLVSSRYDAGYGT
jgi:hypothetical protein